METPTSSEGYEKYREMLIKFEGYYLIVSKNSLANAVQCMPRSLFFVMTMCEIKTTVFSIVNIV